MLCRCCNLDVALGAGHDVCTEQEIKDVATAMQHNGMLPGEMPTYGSVEGFIQAAKPFLYRSNWRFRVSTRISAGGHHLG